MTSVNHPEFWIEVDRSCCLVGNRVASCPTDTSSGSDSLLSTKALNATIHFSFLKVIVVAQVSMRVAAARHMDSAGSDDGKYGWRDSGYFSLLHALTNGRLGCV